MKVYIHQSGSNKDFDFECDSARVIDIKQKILDTKGIPVNIQTLSLSSSSANESYPPSQPLNDDYILSTNENNGDTVHLDLLIHLAGGCSAHCNVLGYPCGVEVCAIQ